MKLLSMLILHAAPALVVAALVLLHPAARPPAVLEDVVRAGVGQAVPAGQPDPVGQGEDAGPLHAGVVEHLDAGPDAGVDAGDVAEPADLLGPAAEEPQGRLTAGGVVDVEALEVVPERAARDDAEPGRLRDRGGGLGRALLAGLAVAAVLAGRRDDRRVVAVPREPVEAVRLRPERDRQQPPALRQLRAHPLGREVGLVAARAALAGDVDADRQERGRLQPGVHLVLLGRQALVEAVAGEVAGRDRVRVRGVRRLAGAQGQAERHRDSDDEGADGVRRAVHEEGAPAWLGEGSRLVAQSTVVPSVT